MGKLATLKENRKQAKDELRAFTDELEAVLSGDPENKIEARAWTPDEEQKLQGLRNRVTQLDTLIESAETDKREAEAQQEERDRKLGGEHNIRVGFEGDLVYSEANPQNSWYRDLLDISRPSPRTPAAMERMQQHQAQVDGILRKGGQGLDAESSRAYRAARSYARETARHNYAESRDVSTGTSSMGDFAPPLYFLPEYGPYRTYGRTLIDQLKHYPMPDTGMVFNVPLITTPTEGVNQTTSTQGAGENTTVATRDMTSTYQTGAVQTIIDNLLVSQQYLDRVGPGIGGDMIVRDDQQRQMNRALNIYAWNALFGSGVPEVAYTDTSFEAFKFNQQVHTAKAGVEKTDGTVAYPTHFFTDVDVWETVEGSYDQNNRPYVVPQGVAFNPLAVGDDAAVPEGYTGFRFAGLQAFKDQAMWVSWSGGAASSGQSTYHPSVVGAFDIASYWMEGPPVVRVLPQPYAQQLTVLIQQYNYCAYVPIYLQAIQVIAGTGTQTSYLIS